MCINNAYVYVHRGWMPGSQRRCGSHVTAIAIFSSVKSSNSLRFIMVCSGLFFHNSDLFQTVRTFFFGDENAQLESSPF